MTEHTWHYAIAVSAAHKTDDISLKSAETQLSNWAQLKARLHIALVGSLPTMRFLGTVARLDDRVHLVKQEQAALWFPFSLKDVRCEIKELGNHVTLYIRDRSQQSCLVVSETDLTAREVFQRFQVPDAIVN